jgi:hypothetical protein
MKIKSIRVDCLKCNQETITSNFALSAIAGELDQAPQMFCQFVCDWCGELSKLDLLQSIDLVGKQITEISNI